ncbi:RNA polymerase sigma factor [Rhizobium sp. BR 362]|uniref:RNA polymerase sigma factor n=1 Tax=Rhizobium sp. BR 362 TaxID=3040670 RepID=UPI002F41DCF0
MSQGDDQSAIKAAEAVARRSYGKLVAILAARTRDVATAEDALSEAFASALADWPVKGAPLKPEAWLLAVARRKMIDAIRRRRVSTAAFEHLKLMAEELEAAASLVPDVPDERLALMFACAHPAIEPGIRAPLILQTILGFDAETIASAFLVSPAAMGQRLARAKNKIRRTRIPLCVPDRADMRARLAAVLEAVYAAYTEGWSDPVGADANLRNLAEEAIWLGRLIVALLPGEAEALGLLALMLYSHARRGARRSPAGEFVPLADQDPALWDEGLIDEAEDLLVRASAFDAFDRYQLEAAIQSAHVVRRRTGATDWAAIERLYDGLCAITGSPVAAINRAIAVAQTRGPAAGLAALPMLTHGSRLVEYQPYWAARAELHTRMGEMAAAREAYDQAIALEIDPAIRRFLRRRQTEILTPPR